MSGLDEKSGAVGVSPPVTELVLRPSGKRCPAPAGSRLFDLVRRLGVPLASSCDGQSTCGLCRLEILSGQEFLSPARPEEEALLSRVKALPGIRIACEARVLEPGAPQEIVVTTGYW